MLKGCRLTARALTPYTILSAMVRIRRVREIMAINCVECPGGTSKSLSDQQRRAQGKLTREHTRPTDLVENMMAAILKLQKVSRGWQVPQLARDLVIDREWRSCRCGVDR